MKTVVEILNKKGRKVWTAAPTDTVREALVKMADHNVGADVHQRHTGFRSFSVGDLDPFKPFVTVQNTPCAIKLVANQGDLLCTAP